MATRMSSVFFLSLVSYLTSWSLVNSQSCGVSECFYQPEDLSPHVVCDVHPFQAAPPCYGEWTSIDNCRCDDDEYSISETGRTYWCKTGSWDPDVYNVKCTGPCTIDVGENVIVRNSAGDIVHDTVDSGDYVQYSCPPGYAGEGTASATCENGAWDDEGDEPFKCLGPCKFANNSLPTDSSVVEPVPHGSVNSFQCEEGYIPRDIETVQCNDGNFVPEIVCSIEQCADDQCELDEENVDQRLNYASPQRYGNLQPPNYCYGKWSFIDTFTCTGSKWVVRPHVHIIYCNEIDGVYQWTEDIHNLTCREPCRRLSAVPTNVKTVDPSGVEAALFEHESYVTYECRDSDHTILGVKTATCLDGSWDNQEVPQCLGSCYFPVNTHSTRNKEEPIPHGDTVILQCDDGYEPRDTVTAHCQDGTFNPELVCTLTT